MSGIVLGTPPAVNDLVQKGLLERTFHDGLIPEFTYRAEAEWEEWPAGTGTEVFMTRRGTLAPITKPTAPGTDPIPQSLSYEQWVATLERYTGTIDTYMPNSVVANSDLFLSNIHGLGIQAGQSLNRIPRNALFKSYLSGHTVLIQATLTTDTVIRVAAINGFTDVVLRGLLVRPQPVSATYPLPILVNGVAKNVIGATPDNPDDPFGSGSLLLSTTVGSVVASRSPVLSTYRPRIIRSGGGLSVDAISAADTFVIQDAVNAATQLRALNVPRHQDGTYHAQIPPQANSQVFQDPAWQRMFQGRGVTDNEIKDGILGRIGMVTFYENNENPDDTNSGSLLSTSASAFYSEDIGAETINGAGVRVGRIIVTGRGALRERGLDESKFITEAGVTGKVGEFSVTNMGVAISTERVRLIMRAPINRLQDQVASTWDISTSFSTPTDVATGSLERYKRAITVEFALE